MFSRLKRTRRASTGPVTAIPPAVIRSVFSSFSKRKASRAALTEVQKGVASFLDQVGGDLSAYAEHAGRATIERADIELLMSRQRLTEGPSTSGVNDYIRRFLPMEYVEKLIPVARAYNDVVPEQSVPGGKRRRKRKAAAVSEDAD